MIGVGTSRSELNSSTGCSRRQASSSSTVVYRGSPAICTPSALYRNDVLLDEGSSGDVIDVQPDAMHTISNVDSRADTLTSVARRERQPLIYSSIADRI